MQLAVADNALWAQSRLPQSTLVSAGLLAGKGSKTSVASCVLASSDSIKSKIMISKFIESKIYDYDNVCIALRSPASNQILKR